MSNCIKKPVDLKRQIKNVGNYLRLKYGKDRFYSIDQVKISNKYNNIGRQASCWSHAFFNDEFDFNLMYSSLDKSCSYASMRLSIINDLNIPNAAISEIDIYKMSWKDLSDLDISFVDFLI